MDVDPLFFTNDDFFPPLLLCGLSLLSFVVMLEPGVRAAALAALYRTGSTAEEREAAMLAALFSPVHGEDSVLADNVDMLLQWAEAHFRTVCFELLDRTDFVPDVAAREHSARRSCQRGSLLSGRAAGSRNGSRGGSRGSAIGGEGGGGGEGGEEEEAQRRPSSLLERLTSHWRSEPRLMGQCDAFISHSWSDPPGPKWAALSAWAEAFEEEHGRLPTVWLDKLCIDQRNVQEALACLPIFLAGCDRLLVLAGPTYSSRLWCVMELFTFLKMGAPLDRIAVLPFAAAAPRHSDSPPERARTSSTLADVAASFASFDAARAQCAQAEDQQALLSVIEESFGSFAEFNLWARHLFDRHAQRDGGASKGEEEMTEMVSLAVHS